MYTFFKGMLKKSLVPIDNQDISDCQLPESCVKSLIFLSAVAPGLFDTFFFLFSLFSCSSFSLFGWFSFCILNTDNIFGLYSHY